MVNDPIADLLIRIKNGYQAQKSEVSVPYSNMKDAVTAILIKEGYVQSAKKEQASKGKKLTLVIKLSYDGKKPAMENVIRVSKPGQRSYAPHYKLPHVMTGYGTAIISTSKGIMTDEEARKAHLGGEVLCKVW